MYSRNVMAKNISLIQIKQIYRRSFVLNILLQTEETIKKLSYRITLHTCKLYTFTSKINCTLNIHTPEWERLYTVLKCL